MPEASRARELDPFSADRMMNAASIARQAGKGWYDDAVNEWATALRLSGETAAEHALKQTYAKSGYLAAKQAALREDLNFWLAVRKHRYVSATRIAANYALLGDKEEAGPLRSE